MLLLDDSKGENTRCPRGCFGPAHCSYLIQYSRLNMNNHTHSNIQLLVTILRLEDFSLSLEDHGETGLNLNNGQGQGQGKFYLSFNVNGDSSTLPRVTLDTLPERISILNLVSGSGQRVNVELCSSSASSSSSHAGPSSQTQSQQQQRATSNEEFSQEILAKGSFLVDSTISKNTTTDQVFSLKMWDTQGKGNAIGTLQLIVEAINTEQHLLHRRKKSFLSIILSSLSQWGWVLNLLLLVVVSFAQLGILLSPSSTAIDRLPIGKLVFRKGASLAQGDYMASCVGFSERFCNPVHLIMQENGSLAIRTGASPHSKLLDDSAASAGAPVTLWETEKLKRRLFQEFRAAVTDSGELSILRGKKVLWKLDRSELTSNPHLLENLDVI